MRYILAFLIALPILSYGQFRIVGNATFTVVNDSTYIGTVTGKPDLTGFGYNAFDIQVNDVLFTAIEYQYLIDSVWDKTRTSATIRVREYDIISDSIRNQTYGKPYGQFSISRLNPNKTIPQVPLAAIGATPQLNTAIDAHNARVAVTELSLVIDSTRLNATADSLYYYSNDTLLYAEKILSGGNDSINLIDSIITLIDNQGSVTLDIKSAYDNTDDQQITLSNDTIYLEDGGFVIIPAVGQDTSITNELQSLSFSNDTLYLSNDGSVYLGAYGIDISGYNASFYISGDTLYLIDDNSTKFVDLSGYLNTDDQQLSFSNDTIYLEDGGFVVLSDNSDTNEIQSISISNDTIYLSDGGFVVLPASTNDSTRLNATNDSLIYYINGAIIRTEPIITYTDGITVLGNGTNESPLYIDSSLFVTSSTLIDSLVNFTTIVDSTRLSDSGDSLLYYQNGLLIGFDTLSKGNGIFQERYIADGVSSNLLITAYNGLLPDDKQDILVYRNGIFIDEQYIISLDQVNGVVQLSFTPEVGDRMMIVWFTGEVNVEVGGGIDSVFTDSTMYGNGTLLFPLGVNQNFMASKEYVDSQFVAAGTGDITGVNEGINPSLEYGILGGGATGSVEVRVDSSIIAAKSWVIAQNYGDIDSVNAGFGLLGGGDVDNVTLSVDTNTIATQNYVDSQGFITGNDTITINGDVTTVSGTTSFTLEVEEADNIEGGGAGDLIYQSSSGQTSFLDLPAFNLAGTKILSNSSYEPFWQDKTAITVGRAIVLDTARTINGVSFDGSQNITIPSNTTETLIRGNYLTGDNFNGSAETTWAVDASSSNLQGKVVVRDGSGNFAATIVTADLNGTATDVSNSHIAGDYILGDNYNGAIERTWAVDTLSLRPWIESISGGGSSLIVTSNGTGDISPVYYNGSSVKTISYNTIGAPSVTGDNAGGTWGIDISGNSATTTKLDTARDFQIAGDAVAANGPVVSFDGTANVLLEIDGINATYLTTGTVPQNRLTGFYDITSALTNAVEWDSVLNKPSTFTPSSHTHPHTDITSKDPYYMDTVNNQTFFGVKTFDDLVVINDKLDLSYLSNVVIGRGAGFNMSATVGNLTNQNVLVGYASGYQLTDLDSNNVMMGYYAGSPTRGSKNVLIGEYTGLATVLNESVMIGTRAWGTQNSTNEIVIGANAQGIGSNTATIGNGITRLKVNNYNFRTDQTVTDGYVLTYNSSNGLIELQDPASGGVYTSEFITFNNSGSGVNSGSSFNGSVPVTVSYNTIGAAPLGGMGAFGTWNIDINGDANFATTSTTSQFTNFPKVNNTTTVASINYDLIFTDFTGVTDNYNLNSINNTLTYNPNTKILRANNYNFNSGESVSGKDGYVLTYDSISGRIQLEESNIGGDKYVFNIIVNTSKTAMYLNLPPTVYDCTIDEIGMVIDVIGCTSCSFDYNLGTIPAGSNFSTSVDLWNPAFTTGSGQDNSTQTFSQSINSTNNIIQVLNTGITSLPYFNASVIVGCNSGTLD